VIEASGREPSELAKRAHDPKGGAVHRVALPLDAQETELAESTVMSDPGAE
jgi:hypothetical protein